MKQCLTANYDSAGHCDPAALGGIEHPLRNLEDREPAVVIGSALEYERAVPTPHRLYEDAPSMPRVEWISNLTNIINMGVSLPGCTTGADRTPHEVLEFRNPTRIGFRPATTDTSCPPVTVL